MDISEYKEKIERKLAVFKDPSFKFIESDHTYSYNGVKYDPVTTFKAQFKIPFDREYWANRKAAERNIDVSVIKAEWAEKALIGTTLGTNVHKWIEDFWSGLRPLVPEDPEIKSRVSKFMKLYREKFYKLVALQPELKIFSKKWRLAGTIDQPFLMLDEVSGEILFLIGDWKTDKEFKDDNHPKGRYKKLLHPFADLWENSLNEYSIQLSLYRLILEDELGIETHGGFLIYLGPDDDGKIYPIKDLRERLRVYLEHNRENFDVFSV